MVTLEFIHNYEKKTLCFCFQVDANLKYILSRSGLIWITRHRKVKTIYFLMEIMNACNKYCGNAFSCSGATQFKIEDFNIK